MSSIYSIVVPVYKSSDSVAELAERVDAVFAALDDREYELIFVNDASPDPATAVALSRVVAANDRVRAIELTKNFGQQPATLCGIRYAVGDYIITMDDDLQHAPEDIVALLAQEQHDIVIACFADKRHHPMRNLLSSIKGYFDHLLIGKPAHIRLSSFRLFSRLVADEILKITTTYPFIPAQLFMVSRDVVNVEVTHHDRTYGNSNYTFGKMVSLFSNLIINNSSLMLTLLGRIGVFSFVGSLLMICYLVLKKLYFGVDISGWTSLMSVLLLIGGLLLLGVGIIGEYLIRIIGNGESLPCYVVRRIERSDDASSPDR